MKFLDVNCSVGFSAAGPSWQGADLASTVEELERAGCEGAVITHLAQWETSAQRGNELVAQATAAHPQPQGCWCLLPESTGETLPPSEIFSRMAAHRIGLLKISPLAHLFVAGGLSVGGYLRECVDRRVHLLVSVKYDMGWQDLYGLLAEFPGLPVIVADHGCWGEDRYFRPLLEAYPGVRVELSNYLLDGGIEDLVSRYGAGRVVFGSGFPRLYPGGMMLALRHADICDEDKALIAGGNLALMLEEERLD